MKTRYSILLSVALIFYLSGCVSNTPKDLMIAEVGIISKKQINEIIERPYHDSWKINEFIVVGLATDVDLIQYAQKRGYSLGVNRWLCEQQSTPIFGSGLFTEQASLYTRLIEMEGIDLISLSTTKRAGEYIYYALVPVKFSQDIEIYGRPERDGAAFYNKYDLKSTPSDLCFKIDGYSYGFGFRSNLVKLKASQVQMIVSE